MANEGLVKVNRALLSVFDKTGLPELARSLHEMGIELISSTGTAKAIAEVGIPVTDVGNITGFPPILGHRVATLHPLLDGAMLADPTIPEHQADMEKYGIVPIELLVINTYPFRQTVLDGGTHKEIMEKIDIGGPTKLMEMVKNYTRVCAVTQPDQYDLLVDELNNHDGCITLGYRESMAYQIVDEITTRDIDLLNHLRSEGFDRS